MMTEEQIYQAGYKRAITDVCDLFDKEHAKLVELWKEPNSTEEEIQAEEQTMFAINTIIYELNLRLATGRVML